MALVASLALSLVIPILAQVGAPAADVDPKVAEATPEPPVVVAEPSPVTPPSTRDGYGRHTLTVDGVAVGFALAGLAANGVRANTLAAAFAVAGVLTYGLGGPIVHVAHDRVGAGGASLALRVGLPLTLGYVGYHLGRAGGCDREDSTCGLGGALLGGLLGAVGAAALDTALLAWAPRAALSVTPVVGSGQLGGVVGGSF